MSKPQSRMHRGFSTAIITITTSIVVLAGIVGYVVLDKQRNTGAGKNTATTSQSTSTTTETSTKISVPDSWQAYQNDRYGFSFRYPSDHTAFSGVDQERRKLIPASSDAKQVSITEKESHVFCCEPLSLIFSVKSAANIQDVSDLDKVNISGHSAFIMRGDGGLGDVYKKLFFPLSGSHWLVVNQSGESRMLDRVLSTLTITDTGPKDPRTKKNQILENIERQYTEEFVSDPAFIKEGTSVKGGQEYEITADNREPVDFVRWDHDGDGTKSLAVLNRAGNVFELMLFDVNENNQISNPRRIAEHGSATWRWRSADIDIVRTYQGKFMRSKVSLGNSAPRMDYYSFQDGSFEKRGRKTAETGDECEVGFVYPKKGTVLKQGKMYEVRWKDLFDEISKTGINPRVSRRNIKIMNENEKVLGKLKTGYGLGHAAEWNSLRTLDLNGDSLTDKGTLLEPGKYKLQALYTYGQKARDRLLEKCDSVDDTKTDDNYYENTFESGWFNVVN